VAINNKLQIQEKPMRRIVTGLVFILLFIGVARAQTNSMTGTVIDNPTGMYGWAAIVIRVGEKKYYVPILGKDVPVTFRTVGKIADIGRTVQVFYTRISPSSDGYDGEVRATKIVEIKKSNTTANDRSSDTCNFCGIWEYYDRESQSKYYLKINTAGAGRFRLIPGYTGVGSQIAWQDGEQSGLVISNADGIYLKPVMGKLVGSFVSMNFRATGGRESTYRITCELRPNGRMMYTVTSSGFTEKHEATKRG
jgi:hypothetical protein